MIKNHETSQNLNSFRKFLFQFFLWVLLMSWNFARVQKTLNQNDAENFSCLYWKTNKIYFQKKKNLNQEWRAFQNIQHCLMSQFSVKILAFVFAEMNWSYLTGFSLTNLLVNKKSSLSASKDCANNYLFLSSYPLGYHLAK